MKLPRLVVLSAGLGLFAPGVPALADPQGSSDTPTYANVELVSIDAARRVVVVRSPRGATITYDMDDLYAGTASVKPGDRVILTLRGGSGIQRVSRIALASTESGKAAAPKTEPVVKVSSSTVPQGLAKDAFAQQVALLSERARSVDSQWTTFVSDCNAKTTSTNDGRPWFGLWDNRVQADYSKGSCRELFNQIVASGELIKQGMASADETARKTLTPGEIREVRRAHMMDWDGWTLPVPQKREP
jgi:hypothetical protein